MVRLAMLLVGAKPFRRHWAVLPAIGLAWMAIGVWLIADASDGVLLVTVDVLGLLLVVEGIASLFGVLAMGSRAHSALTWRAVLLLAFGVMVLMPLPVDHGIPDRILFGMAFLADGLLRIASAWVVRFARWHLAIAAGVVEVLLAWMVLGNWPIHHHYTVPMCLGIALLASGWSLVRLGLQLRQLKAGESITSLPLFFARPWHTRNVPRRMASHVPDYSPPEPMLLYVWTPAGSATDPQRRLLVDRYIAAVDSKGVISTGHSALELLPDVYISHYPGVEIDHSPDDFTRLLRAGAENDIVGRWIPSHATEVADWCEPDQQVEFPHYDAEALRAFWHIYRQDNTYNLTSRSCSTVTSLAIESALEGVLGQQRPWLRFFLLLTDPNLWLAAILRRRGATMAWTPGLVLDYARLLRVIVQRQDQRWFMRLGKAISGYRRAAAAPSA
ncbi:MAG: hypothetical protein ABWZ08_01725 [Pseudoxanthomonas sp.]